MTDDERKIRTACLNEMVATDGWKIVVSHIKESIVDGMEGFMSLPVDRKTSKAAYEYTAKYKVHRNY